MLSLKTLRRQRGARGDRILPDEVQLSKYFSRDQVMPKPPPRFCPVHSPRSCFLLICSISLLSLLLVVYSMYTALSSQEGRSQASPLPGRLDLEEELPQQETDPLVRFSVAEDLELSGWWQQMHPDCPENLQSRIEELHTIRISVLQELRRLEEKRSSLREQIAATQKKLNDLQAEFDRRELQSSSLLSAIEQAKIRQKELAEQETPEIQLPIPLKLQNLQENLDSFASKFNESFCNMDTCFDFSVCSITSGFTFWIAKATLLAAPYSKLLEANFYSSKSDVCVAVHLVDSEHKLESPVQEKRGRNNLVVFLNSETSLINNSVRFSARDVIASPEFDVKNRKFRPKFDIIIPPILDPSLVKDDVWKELPPILPAKRRYLLSFWGRYFKSGLEKTDPAIANLVASLDAVYRTKTRDRFQLTWDCGSKESHSANGSWLLCGNSSARADILRHSTFSLVLPGASSLLDGAADSSSAAAQFRLVEALKFGAIPVILGSSAVPLPFDEFLDWSLAAVRLPSQRVSELHFVLRAFSDSEIIEFRRQGRRIYESFLATPKAVLATTLSVLRMRLFLPPPTRPDGVRGKPVFPEGGWSPPESQLTEMPVHVDPEEYLGPPELPYPSPAFQANFSSVSSDRYRLWNNLMIPHLLFPQLPSKLPMPSEAQFHPGTSIGFRPIKGGQGGSGKEFSQSLGGNFPREQFTIVLLTYERESVLVSSLQRFNQLPYLNRVVVVWNNPRAPTSDIAWPRLTAPLVVVRPGNNSLNNRFLPFSHIDTEAVLSIDDDVHLTQAEIIFAFRVWREHRDQIVGFPARFHAWDVGHRSWLYNSNHSCELSMVLTGAAFYHSSYAWMYWEWMPQAIRDKVDEVMNCEDLAMNFLVSHLTRKPPVKATSKWTFQCPGCSETLSADESHFTERHHCIQFFSRVFGYNPLLFTQYRVDSVLFKTRLPHQHQKCFKFI